MRNELLNGFCHRFHNHISISLHDKHDIQSQAYLNLKQALKLKQALTEAIRDLKKNKFIDSEFKTQDF